MFDFSCKLWLVASLVATALAAAAPAAAQQPSTPIPSQIPAQNPLQTPSPLLQGPAPTPPGPNEPLTLQAALTLARANSQQIRAALVAAQLATEDRVQARAALLPAVNGLLQHIYTEP